MRVNELIAILQQYPPNTLIVQAFPDIGHLEAYAGPPKPVHLEVYRDGSIGYHDGTDELDRIVVRGIVL
jgi:hypothetical protein